MAAILARPAPVPTERNNTPPPHLPASTSQRGASAPVPNKHLPYCAPGPLPHSRAHQQQQQPLDTPPASPPLPNQFIETASTTYPPDDFEKVSTEPLVFGITAEKLARALEQTATQPLPLARHVFPWMHGLHNENQLQLAFFGARKKSVRRTPRCIRGLTILKAGGDLSHSKLKGAIAPDEILRPIQAAREQSDNGTPDFLDVDPRDGFNVRNFQIQACKMATVSDIIVYGDNQTPRDEVLALAEHVSRAQLAWQVKTDGLADVSRRFNTFIVTDDYTVVEADQPDLVSLDSEGCLTGKSMDFFHAERVEMSTMSAASEIAHNVWLGPTPDPNLTIGPDGAYYPDDQPEYDLFVECSDMAQVPDSKAFKFLEDALDQKESAASAENVLHQLEFPGSGAIMPPTWSQSEVDGLLATCEWIYKQANRHPQPKQRRDSKLSLTPPRDGNGDTVMTDVDCRDYSGRKIFIHCTDGYTESSLLAIAYYMYAECVPVHQAWLELHMDKRRNFFAYSSDVHLLRAIQPRILQSSPKHSGDINELCPPTPEWLDKMDGSLPSRILPYMYLGNLGHANNPELLRTLCIGQILSIGEPISWSSEAAESWPSDNLLFIDRVQDNGVDPLTNEFGRCLEFIEDGRKKGTATLVHCRVGVSRSATICIAEVMNELGLSFPRAYCFVRARRLNVIIQPHLRFTYELLKWEEFQCQKRGRPVRRELEWATISREIAAMNKPYSRQN